MIREILLPQNSEYSEKRFDINVVGGRTFSLMGETEQATKEWTAALARVLGKRRNSVKAAIAAIRDDQVEAQYWKKNTVTETTPNSPSTGSTPAPLSPSDSQLRLQQEQAFKLEMEKQAEDEEEQERIRQLEAIMQESNQPKSPNKSRKSQPEAVVDEVKEKGSTGLRHTSAAPTSADAFLQRQYLLGAIRAIGKEALKPSVMNQAKQQGITEDDVQQSLPASNRHHHDDEPTLAETNREDSDHSSSHHSRNEKSPTSSPAFKPTEHQRSDSFDSPSPTSPKAAEEGHSGILWKLSPHGLLQVWQKRLFAIRNKSLCYYKSNDRGVNQKNLLGAIPVDQIVRVAMSADKNKPNHFDVQVLDGRIYHLKAEDEQKAKEWVAHIQYMDGRKLGCTFPTLSPGPPVSGVVAARVTKKPAYDDGLLHVGKDTNPGDPAPAGTAGQDVAIDIAVMDESSAERERREDQALQDSVRTFWNFLKNTHSLLSIFFNNSKAGFPRLARFFLLAIDILLNILFVFIFMAQDKLTGVQQVVVIVIILAVIQAILSGFIKWFCFDRFIPSCFRFAFVLFPAPLLPPLLLLFILHLIGFVI